MPAPIAFFAYNRPVHTLRTIEALAQCDGAKESEVYFFCDGPKPNASADDIQSIEKVRAVLKSQSWPSSSHFIFKESNVGLASSITDGISHVLQNHDDVIVVEDDLVMGSGFLNYLNGALDHYRSIEKVMHISAYLPPIDSSELPPLFFYNQASCWGWATWKRAWSHYNSEARTLKELIEKRDLVSYFNIDGSYQFMKHLEKNIDGRLNTWAIKWQASVLLNNGLCLHPHRSLVSNIGVDGSGAHMTSQEASGISSKTIDSIALEFPDKLLEHIEGRERIASHYRAEASRLNPNKLSILQRLTNKLKSILRG